MRLIEWTQHYIDYLNSFKQNLLNKDIKEECIVADYAGKGKITYIVKENLDEKVLKDIGESIILVCLNSKNNVRFLIEHWSNFSRFRTLKIIFSNPELNMQWTLIPFLHDRFADPDALKTGLKSLFSSVPECNR